MNIREYSLLFHCGIMLYFKWLNDSYVVEGTEPQTKKVMLSNYAIMTDLSNNQSDKKQFDNLTLCASYIKFTSLKTQ